ncbi:MAG: FG-GAP repeat domain-containing protein [Verrucomicrobiia bacterium]
MKTAVHRNSRTELARLRQPASGPLTKPGLKQTTRAALFVLLTTVALWSATAQVSFTRILEGDIAKDAGTSVGCAWGDFDNDGYPDLFVANAVGSTNRLYHNNGNGSFTRIRPVTTSGGMSHGCTWADYDGDGDLDLFVAGGHDQNERQFRNDGNAVFTRITTGAPVTAGGDNNGVAFADYDNDGDMDLLVTGFRSSGNRLYRNDGTNGFVRVTEGPLATTRGASQNPAWGDYDNDGHLDLFIANSCERDVSKGENNFLFHNEGDGTFTRVTEGAAVIDGGRSWGCGWADYDNDGDLDLFVANDPHRMAIRHRPGVGERAGRPVPDRQRTTAGGDHRATPGVEPDRSRRGRVDSDRPAEPALRGGSLHQPGAVDEVRRANEPDRHG